MITFMNVSNLVLELESSDLIRRIWEPVAEAERRGIEAAGGRVTMYR
jgi:hypothetical protein